MAIALSTPFQMAQMQLLSSQLQMLSPLVFAAARVQVARASNRNIITGNLAAVTTGVQTASPVNVA
jgi:hypothetical protein